MTMTEEVSHITGAFTSEQDELRATAERFLADHSLSDAVRELMETGEGFDDATWKQIAELGWLGIAIPEEYGGLGSSLVEVGILLEEMGKRLFCAPYLSTVVLGATAILNAGTEEQKRTILPGIAEGTTRTALALGESVSATKRKGTWALDGTTTHVVDGCTATLLIVAARTGASGVSLFLVDPAAEGVRCTPLETFDRTRKQAAVEFAGAPAILLGEEGTGAAAIERTIDVASAMLASEIVGGAQRCLDMSVEYAKERMQFGRAIGSFQAIKHRCAEMFMKVEMARSAAYYAARAAAEPDDELSLVAPLAKAYSSEAFSWVASETIQIHGGIAFTFEHDAHLYFRRAKSMEAFLGSPDHHREVLVTRLGL